jgi:hypothetical protein
MRSISATDVPPNFITSLAMDAATSENFGLTRRRA